MEEELQQYKAMKDELEQLKATQEEVQQMHEFMKVMMSQSNIQLPTITCATPLWRNGPPEKPIFCNACGSRFRLRGTLLNYAPKHLMVIPSSNNNKSKRRNKTVKTENNFTTSLSSYPNDNKGNGSRLPGRDRWKISIDSSLSGISLAINRRLLPSKR
ncbi:hypothetical protein Dsin_032293 [Dipteronia sinensis]|uniref:GATA-type domain-containing protein n=1 Tax=Dipteronia sinensis TaxID=43782 RepID=A0AAD9ZN42_9ROSI|nr:hypothetical protein Dsin_032293 [Dipteronia sinensis]